MLKIDRIDLCRTDEHGVIAQHCRNLNNFVHASVGFASALYLVVPQSLSNVFVLFQPRVAAHDILTRSCSLDTDQRNELEAIIHDLEDENQLLQSEYERLCQQHMEKSLIINDQHQQFYQSDSQLGSSSYLNDYNSSDREMLREAKQLRHHKTKLEQRMRILEEHNKQLEKQLRRSKQLLLREVICPSPCPHGFSSNRGMFSLRCITIRAARASRITGR